MSFALLLFIPLIFILRDCKKYLLTLAFGSWASLALINQEEFRYTLSTLPFLSILLAILVFSAWKYKKWLGYAFLALLLSTNIFATLPWTAFKIIANKADISLLNLFSKADKRTTDYVAKLDSEIKELRFDILKIEYAAYYDQLTKDYNDPMRSAISFLKDYAKPDDIIALNFGQLAMAFYTPFKVGNMIDAEKLRSQKAFHLPEYIFDQELAKFIIPRSVSTTGGPYIEESSLVSKKLSSFDLGVDEIYWDPNWPQHFDQYLNKFYFCRTSGKNAAVYIINDAI